ncbi:3-keto-disaccharide hydrolase [Hufsiella ginkgonis]|uniref:DUF1080 domain-containing protein n=1 Tax=Hufsiella ginkgonis TaxID=2695274 RepID=A0A7K1Y1G9_9SPHI|nr:DUF1080 domain-containing protein [Hufsiella ginkgonis]MXV17071.1 DUF1080 domain-containing protein [Hufsiella ginkgonis]
MKLFTFLLFFLLTATCAVAQQDAAYTPVLLTGPNSFKPLPANWKLVSEVFFNPLADGDPVLKNGTGVLVNIPAKNKKWNEGHLLTNMEHGDLDLDLDLMMAKGSNSGIYLQGRYEVRLSDSWGKQDPDYTDAGGIYKREANTEGAEGRPPAQNVSRAPGLWQHMQIVFRAPRFNAEGKKTENARLVKVIYNGVTIQENIELSGPTTGGIASDETAMAPLMFQGDHGQVALRNIRYRVPPANTEPVRRASAVVNPILVSPGVAPVVHRGFLNYNGKKLTAPVAVGYPQKVSYAYDLDKGRLLEVWRGDFLDATGMWYSRGEQQLAVALGSLIVLPGKPTLAFLPGKDSVWPDSNTAAYNYLGYDLLKDGSPVFKYQLGDAMIRETLTPDNSGKRFTHSISAEMAKEAKDLWFRVAEGSDIALQPGGLYAVNDKQYYIQLPEKVKPLIRKTAANTTEMLLPVTIKDQKGGVNYELVW